MSIQDFSEENIKANRPHCNTESHAFEFPLEDLQKTWFSRKREYEIHAQTKMNATEDFPVMRRFVDVICRDMLARDIFWKEPVETIGE